MRNESGTSWARLLVEAVAIVLSILLAFAIDAAWEDRQERRFERETLQALLDEYQDHKEVLVAHRQGHLEIRRAVAGLSAACRGEAFEPGDTLVDLAMFAMRVPATADLKGGTRDALLSSGRLSALSNRLLRFQLAEWQSVVDELADDQRHGVRLVFDLILPYLTRHGVPITIYEGPENRPLLEVGRRLSDDPAAMQRLFADPEFLSILEVRYDSLTHTTGEFDSVIAATEAILQSIEESRDR